MPMSSHPSYSVYHQISFPEDHTFKLLQLTPDLVEYLKSSDNNELIIKAPKNSSNQLVLCTEDKTWKIRQMNHSNTVLLMDNMNINKSAKSIEHIYSPENALDNKLVGFSSLSYEYELTSIPGHIDISKVPIYDGTPESINQKEKYDDVSKVLEDSPVSKNEFYKEWYNLCGSEIDSKAVILSKEFVTEGLQLLIPILITNNINYKNDSFNINLEEIADLMYNENTKYTQNITETILNKFGIKNETSTAFKLNNLAIAKWFGIQTFHSTKSQLISPKDFLLKWKSSFPPFYNVPIDLNQLKGYYCRPIADTVKFLNPSGLTKGDLNVRIKELFQMVKEWDYDEFLPFIQEFIPSGRKPESIILKYAKKRRVAKNKFVVCPR